MWSAFCIYKLFEGFCGVSYMHIPGGVVIFLIIMNYAAHQAKQIKNKEKDNSPQLNQLSHFESTLFAKKYIFH